MTKPFRGIITHITKDSAWYSSRKEIIGKPGLIEPDEYQADHSPWMGGDFTDEVTKEDYYIYRFRYKRLKEENLT